MFKTEIKNIHCLHSWNNEGGEGSNEVMYVCEKCNAIELRDSKSSELISEHGQSLVDVLGIEKTKLSWKTRLNKRRIVFKHDAFKTEYFARKNALMFAAKLFEVEQFWFDVSILIGFDDGQGSKGWVEAKFPREVFYMGAPLEKGAGMIARWSKKDVLEVSKIFCLTRRFMYIKANSRIERIAKNIMLLRK
jgi:hypothetical protein